MNHKLWVIQYIIYLGQDQGFDWVGTPFARRLFIIIKFIGWLGSSPLFLFRRIFNSQLTGNTIVCTHSGLYSSFISQSFHLEILNSDFLTKFWRYYHQSVQRLSTRVSKYFRPFESLQELSEWNFLFADSRGKRIPISSRNFFAEEENHTWAPRLASNLWPLHVNVEILSRSPQKTEDFTGMLENDEIKHKI